MKIVYCAYRNWAVGIYEKLIEHYGESQEFILFSNHKSIVPDLINKIAPDLILFYGWSWLVPKAIVENYMCICLHPSKLPLYRGGSPIQNQLIDGCRKSAVTLFKMSQNLDDGPIAFQEEFDLNGYLDEILAEITRLGLKGSITLINQIQDDQIYFKEQNHSLATFCKRRTPKESELVPENFLNNTAEYFYNLIRGLQYPYPKAFIKCKNNTKLFINEVEYKNES